jgi:hypothetical protein
MNEDIQIAKISRELAEALIRNVEAYQDRVVLSAYLDILLCDFDDYHIYVEKILGRPVMIHEIKGQHMKIAIRKAASTDAEAILNRLA